MILKASAMTAKKKSSKKPVKVALLSPKELDDLVVGVNSDLQKAFIKALFTRTSKVLRSTLGS